MVGAVAIVVAVVVVLPGLFLVTGAMVCAALGMALDHDPADRALRGPIGAS